MTSAVAGSTAVKTDSIEVRGAETHNLQHVDVDIPLGKLTVITGVSGSGKSSLAFDTLFAEGQRRYLESVSVHTRSLLTQLPRASLRSLTGLPPTVSVDQRVNSVPPRSTLAITTEIYDYLRLLYARIGTAHCTGCGQPVQSQSTNEIVERIERWPDRTKLMILAPLVRDRKGAHRDVLESIAGRGFVRARIDAELTDISDPPKLTATQRHSIDAVIDRIILKDGITQRLRESIELAVRESDGSCIVCRESDGQWIDEQFSTRFSCPDCNLSFLTPEPRTFSFNSAWGACPVCEGFGVTGSVEQTDELTLFSRQPCEECEGTRLQPFARSITFRGETLPASTSRTVDDALERTTEWCQELQTTDAESTSSAAELAVLHRTLPDIQQRLQRLTDVGLGYLNLDRPTRTLSGGEYQRARLAACLGSSLHGACFVLDEPTSGLHPRDTARLIETLQNLKRNESTVIVVEHDGELMKAADHIIDLGPQAGAQGGRLMYSGPAAKAVETDSPTGAFLRDELPKPPVAAVRDQPVDEVTIVNARQHNLKVDRVSFPLHRLVCVTGVSGSGKSTLIVETLLPIATAQLQQHDHLQQVCADVGCERIDGLDSIQRIVPVDTSLPGRNRRACIATYSGIWNEVRKVLAKTRQARLNGFTPGRFSFNSGDGRCSVCRGSGLQDLKMSLLPDVTVPCAECGGQRFNRATLAVTFNDLHAAEILELSIDEAADFFSQMDRILSVLETFQQVGLGYLKLGQPFTTLSGGEAQRIKLAVELSRPSRDHTLFVMDEPTRGLHAADIVHLQFLLRRLVEQGHSVVVVEHNLQVIAHSDWVIDLGPDSGPAGGTIVVSGTPASVAASGTGHTSNYLNKECFLNE